MADEAVVSLMPGKVDYTLKYYLQFNEMLCAKAKELNKTGLNLTKSCL